MIERISKNQIELRKVKNDEKKTDLEKIGITIRAMESMIPTDSQFGEVTKYMSALDEIDRGIIKNKLLQLIKNL